MTTQVIRTYTGWRTSQILLIALASGIALCNSATGIAQSNNSDAKQEDSKVVAGSYETFYLTNTEPHSANEIQTDLRNMLSRARIYYVPSAGALSVQGTDEDLRLARKLITEIDRAAKSYRLTYTFTETSDGKVQSTRRYAMVVTANEKTSLKEGNRIPLVTGMSEKDSSSQVQYIDVGTNIEATLDGPRLRTKVEESSMSTDKSPVVPPDPVIRQNTLEVTATLVEGKPLVLGTIDMPGSTRHLEVSVVSELVK